MSGYSDFSRFYDCLNNYADYEARADYIIKLFERFDSVPTLMLDFACGTGAFCREFAALGIDTIGVDPSDQMLCLARNYEDRSAGSILYLCQDGRSLELYGTVNGAVSCLDSINHIVDSEELLQAFKNIALYLEPGRLFIFDVNTLYKHRNVLADNSFVYENDSVFCAWQNTLQDDGETVEIQLDFFEPTENGTYERYFDSFYERAYPDEQLRDLLKSAGLEVVGVFGDMSFEPPKDNSERNYYVTRRI